MRVVDVAGRAGTSPTSVIYHFASTYQLFEQAAADADRAFYAALRPELAALESGVDPLAWLIVRASRSEWPLWMDTWLFARQSVHVVDVAERAETSPTSVIYHFASKYQLFEQAAADADRAFYAALRPELAALESGGCDYAALLQAADRVPIPSDPQSPNREEAE